MDLQADGEAGARAKLEPGTVLSERYRVVGVLGEGGMGAVYEAENITVGRKVAVKVLHPEFAKNTNVVARFQQEARLAAGIGHEHIVEVFDFGTYADAPYMVLELLKGESLGARLQRVGRMLPEAAGYIMSQVLAALGAAHAAGIVHRDLKPDNVFLTRRSSTGDFVKLLDFGISKLHEEENAQPRGFTQTGLVVGTPDYMAPEQALAKRNIDRRADVYAAGVVLYQMLTGVLPFDAETDRELLAIVAFRPKGLTSPREHNPAIPEALEAVILKAMALDRADRYSTAEELAEAISPWRGDAPPAARSGAFPALSSMQPPTPLHWERPTSVASINAVAVSLPATSSPTAPPVRIERRSSLLWAGAAGAALFAIVVGARMVSSNRAPTTVAARTLQPAAAPAAIAIAPTEPRPVAVDVEGLSPDAELRVDGAISTSQHLRFVAGTDHHLHVTAHGMLPFETTVHADRDRSIFVTLSPEPVAVLEPVVAPAPAPRANGRAGRNQPASANARHAATNPPNGQTPAPAQTQGRTMLPFNTEY